MTTRPTAAKERAGPLARALLLALALAVPAAPALAQSADPFGSIAAGNPEAKMLLEADQLVYDFDSKVVTAIGGVQIYYNGYSVQSARVTYEQQSGRLTASGGVRIVEPDGNIINAEFADITDTFRDGFLQSLNVETIDRARFAATSAERRNGNVTVFREGVYTACEPCKEDPQRPPLWQIKAKRVIHDKKTRTVYYEHASIEFFGVPIAYTPYFFHPDPTVKRKTGFLIPRIQQAEALGFGVTTPFFWNLAPNYDLTFSPTVYSQQGVLAQIEWRHRILRGSYNVRVSGIFQQAPDEFAGLSGDRDFRGSVQTAGMFQLTPNWKAGWDITTTTDRTFGRDYKIEGATALDVPSTIYLTGFSERNSFDLRGYYFRVQREDTVEYDSATGAAYTHDDQQEQAVVHPVLDHNYVFDRPILGGELRLDSNLTSLSRVESDRRTVPAVDYYNGLAGTFTRASTDASWQRRIMGPGGQLFTPFAYLKTDLNWVAADNQATGLAENDTLPRAMPAVGLEYRWPFIATSRGVTQTFSPIAQIIVRPNEQHVGELPNEDAQSLVFDDTVLFSWDKFSGYDRQEGGTRANIGASYFAQFGNGWSVDALAGQSYQIAGRNSYEEQDPSLTGIGSGLDSAVSDYVGRVTIDSGRGVSLTARGRFDEKDFTLNRTEVTSTFARGRNSATLGYAYLKARPEQGIETDRREVAATAVAAVTKTWSVRGGITYDLENEGVVKQSIGLAYDDECFNLSATYAETRDRYSDIITDKQIFVRFNLRTIGDTALTSNVE
ncbi:LPS-assembly protein LptD [Propylenella binzhouense]|uniref:LPS-assembly protein LptD n=1 Tax=Propylenella binzhouense TaxID=2555902 RepID=A0A964WV69_9HYPH|nr:LPS-assembly protein LptD [Propylenella binzhouense]MYZ49851.1 LPS-assembly protein LptD [Propylenella binzhouense]